MKNNTSNTFEIKNPLPLASSIFSIITFITLNIQAFFPKFYIITSIVFAICIYIILRYITSDKITKKISKQLYKEITDWGSFLSFINSTLLFFLLLLIEIEKSSLDTEIGYNPKTIFFLLEILSLCQCFVPKYIHKISKYCKQLFVEIQLPPNTRKIKKKLMKIIKYLEKEYKKHETETNVKYQKQIIEKIIIKNEIKINNFCNNLTNKNIANHNKLDNDYKIFTKDTFQVSFFNKSLNFYFNKDWLMSIYTLPICIENICKKKTLNYLNVNLNKNKDGFVLDTLEHELTEIDFKFPFINELLKTILTQNDLKFNLRNKVAHIEINSNEKNELNANLLFLSLLILLYIQ